MTLHEIVIDEDHSADSSDLGQPIFSAYCTDECGWHGKWCHPDEFFGYADPVAAAENAASEEGKTHLRDEGLDPL